MIFTTAALIAIATALAMTETRPHDDLLACAADRYRAAGAVARVKDASGLAATKGMGAITPSSRRAAEASRLRAEGDAFRQRAASDLSRRDIMGRYPNTTCAADRVTS